MTNRTLSSSNLRVLVTVGLLWIFAPLLAVLAVLRDAVETAWSLYGPGRDEL